MKLINLIEFLSFNPDFCLDFFLIEKMNFVSLFFTWFIFYKQIFGHHFLFSHCWLSSFFENIFFVSLLAFATRAGRRVPSSIGRSTARFNSNRQSATSISFRITSSPISVRLRGTCHLENRGSPWFSSGFYPLVRPPTIRRPSFRRVWFRRTRHIWISWTPFTAFFIQIIICLLSLGFSFSKLQNFLSFFETLHFSLTVTVRIRSTFVSWILWWPVFPVACAVPLFLAGFLVKMEFFLLLLLLHLQLLEHLAFFWFDCLFHFFLFILNFLLIVFRDFFYFCVFSIELANFLSLFISLWFVCEMSKSNWKQKKAICVSFLIFFFQFCFLHFWRIVFFVQFFRNWIDSWER